VVPGFRAALDSLQNLLDAQVQVGDAIPGVPAGDRFEPAVEWDPCARAKTIDHQNPQTAIRLLLANEIVQDEIVGGYAFADPEIGEILDGALHQVRMAMRPKIIEQAARNQSVIIPADFRQQSTAEVGFNPTMVTRHVTPDRLIAVTLHPLSRRPFAMILVKMIDRLPDTLVPRRRAIEISGQLFRQRQLDAEIRMLGMQITRPFPPPGEWLPPSQRNGTVT